MRLLLASLLCTTNTGAMSASTPLVRFIDPTGTYKLIARSYTRGYERYGYKGEVRVSLIDSATIAVSFYANMGGPSYNSGAFVDTLAYQNNVAVYTTPYDSSCAITLMFSNTRVTVIERVDNPNCGCGFGQGVMADGTYRKVSSMRPEIVNLQIE